MKRKALTVFPNQTSITWSTFMVANTKVHIWHAPLTQPENIVQKLGAVLSEEETERAERLRFRQRRQSFIVGRGILRNLLSHYTGIDPHQIQFAYSQAGKPFLSDTNGVSDLCFNLTHSDGLALYAFSWGPQVGIDVEAIRPIEEMDQIAYRNFSTEEFRKFRALHNDARLRAFYYCWTRKEAFIKAVGEGMSFPLREFEVSLEPDEPAEILSIYGSTQEARKWSMHDLKTWDGYAAALVVEGNDHIISYKQWTYSQMMGPAAEG